MDNGLLILKRIVEGNKRNHHNKESRKVLIFDVNEDYVEIGKCAIAIVGINDKHTGKKPELIECFSVPDLYAKLRFVLPRGGMPPYNYVMRNVRDNNFVFKLIKEDINGQIRYRA